MIDYTIYRTNLACVASTHKDFLSKIKILIYVNFSCLIIKSNHLRPDIFVTPIIKKTINNNEVTI